MKKEAVAIYPRDNVATGTVELKKGRRIGTLIGDTVNGVVVQDDVPFGHKSAIRDIAKGRYVIIYGESIGRATSDIKVGEHVHVHNVESERGRGDL